MLHPQVVGPVAPRMKGLLSLLALLPVIAATAALYGSQNPNPASRGGPIRLAVLATSGTGDRTHLHLAYPGQPLAEPVATLTHPIDAAVAGTVLADGAVAVAVDFAIGTDRSFGSFLFRLEAGAAPKLLCRGVAYASRPFVTDDGRVYVQRGTAGAERSDAMRIDALTVDEVDPVTGVVINLWHGPGYVAYVAGAFREDLVLYIVSDEGARLLLVDQNTGTERLIAPSIPPFANSFSVSRDGELLFQNRDAVDVKTWNVVRLDLGSGDLEPIEQSSAPMTAVIWPGGELTIGDPTGDLQERSGLRTSTVPEVLAVRSFAADGTAAAGLVFRAGSSAPEVVVIASDGSEIGRIAPPARTRLDVAGFAQ